MAKQPGTQITELLLELSVLRVVFVHHCFMMNMILNALNALSNSQESQSKYFLDKK